MSTVVYALLAALSAVYAAILERFKDHCRWEPDWTWLEVVIGTALCLAAPAFLARRRPADWQTYEQRTWGAFVVGGTPIVLWQLWRTARNKRELHEEAQRLLAKER